jgi:hypothetical protein
MGPVFGDRSFGGSRFLKKIVSTLLERVSFGATGPHRRFQ